MEMLTLSDHLKHKIESFRLRNDDNLLEQSYAQKFMDKEKEIEK
jgi:hypothetical protein